MARCDALICSRDEHGLGPLMGRVGLFWVGSHFPAHVIGWVGLNEKYCDFLLHFVFVAILCAKKICK